MFSRLTQDHQELHEDGTSNKSIDVDIPHSTSTLGPRDVDVEKLIFVHDGREPEGERSANGDKRSERGVDQSDCAYPEQIDDNDRIFEIGGFGHFANFSWSVGEYESSDRDHGEFDELDQFEDDQETSQSSCQPRSRDVKNVLTATK